MGSLGSLRPGHTRYGTYLTLIARLVVGSVFLGAGVGKAVLGYPVHSMSTLATLVPLEWIHPGLAGLLLVEMLIGSLLLLGLAQRWAAFGAAVLFVLFVGTMLAFLAHGATLDCWCAGPALAEGIFRQTVNSVSTGRDLLWLLLCLHLLVSSPSQVVSGSMAHLSPAR